MTHSTTTDETTTGDTRTDTTADETSGDRSDVITNPETPAGVMAMFAQRLAAGDLDGLVAMYADDAVFQPAPGVELRCGDIRAALGELLALRPTITYSGEPAVLHCGELALVSNDWSMEGTAPDGSTVREGGCSADVVRREADGTWRILIDQPRGTLQ
jgi:ketosteroid isomerase-like protein